MHSRTLAPREWEIDRVLFERGQWAVTEFGIENTCGPYHYALSWSDISLDIAPGKTWVDHMARKNWVVADDFRRAHDYAKLMMDEKQEV